MSGQTTCPRCQTPLAAGTKPEACPRCLLEAALSEADLEAPEGAPAPPTPEELSARFPDLEILELVGQGGMGIVYRARQVKLDRIVALKILPSTIAESPDFATRFAREARTMARLDHPNIVRIYEFGETDGLYYLVMEFIDGSNLRPIIEGGGLAPAEALAIIPQICEALQYAHERGVVHRDIKPENVLVTRAGQVKITDFGLAKLIDAVPGEMTLTNAGQVMGTIHYMAPEQYRTPKDVDHRADIYSLGVVFYEMLTGEVPMGHFQAPSEKVAVDVRLDQVVLRSLEKERERRYQHASDVRNEVTGIVQTPEAAPADEGRASVPPAAPSPPIQTKPPLCRLAVWGFVSSLGSILILPVLLMLLLAPMDADSEGPGPIALIVPILPLAIVLTGFALSIAGWVKIGRSNGRLRGLGYAITGTLLPIPVLLAALVLSMYMVRGGPAEMGPTMSGGTQPSRIVSSEPLPVDTPVEVPSMEEGWQADAERQIEDIWRWMRDTQGRKVTPKELLPHLFHPVEAGRMRGLHGGDGLRLQASGLLWRPPPGDTGASMFERYSLQGVEGDGDGNVAIAKFSDGEHGYELQVLRDGTQWRFGLAPARFDGEVETDAVLRVEGGPTSLSSWERAALQSQVEILWSNLLGAHETLRAAAGAGTVGAELRFVVAPSELGGLRDGTRRPEDGVPSFLRAWSSLPDAPSTYALQSIMLNRNGRSARVVYALADGRIEFPVLLEDDRWWLGEE